MPAKFLDGAMVGLVGLFAILNCMPN